MHARSWFRLFGFGVAITGATASAWAQVTYQQQPGYQQPSTAPQPGYAQSGYPQPATVQQPGYAQPYPQPATVGYQQSGATQPYVAQPVYQATSSSGRKRDSNEMGALYVTSVAYGAGLGLWVSTELKLQNDPAPFLIAPLILGVAAPIGAFALDHPSMKRGQPSAITAGLLLGAGEGLGIWSTQAVRADSADAWKFRGLSRAAAIGSTLGGLGGYLAGEFLEPPPMTSWLAVSGAFWGTAVGSMFTYGATSGSSNWGKSNDKTSVGGLVGYNVGMLAAGGLGALTVPSVDQVAWMWAGGGIGAAVSLPVFLFYIGDGGPPARRGFIFMGTATTLGIVAGGLFSSDAAKVGMRGRRTVAATSRSRGSFVHLEAVLPVISSDQLGLSFWGSLE
jgi:hypothetical protein